MSGIDIGAMLPDGDTERFYSSPFFEYSPVQCTDGQKSEVFILAPDEKTKVFSLGNIRCEQGGCILEVSLKLKDVAPGRRVAVGVLLEEETEGGGGLCHGARTIAVPAHRNSAPSDIPLDHILFVLPRFDAEENVRPQRRFRVSAVSHYMDADFGRLAERRPDHE